MAPGIFSTAPKKIYVAAPTNRQHEALRVAFDLQCRGFEVTSSWLTFDFNLQRPSDDAAEAERCRFWGQKDVEDLERADTLLLMAEYPSTSGGYHVELGYFLGAHRSNILVVGNRPNVFYHHHTVKYVDNADYAVGFLEEMRELLARKR